MSEKISELIDGRGAPAQRQDLFDHIIADHAAGRVWRHYHLIGCVLRGEVEQHGAGGGIDLSARIEARLDAESAEPAEPAESAAPVARFMPMRRAWTAAAKAGAAATVATVALAAALAVVAVIVLRPGADSGGARVAGTAPAAAERVRFGPEFGEMLAQHGEFASSPGLNGLIVHAKFVNHQPLER